MSDKKGKPFPLIIIAVILGWAIFKQFDFRHLRFEKPALAILYIVTFVFSVFLLLKKDRNSRDRTG